MEKETNSKLLLDSLTLLMKLVARDSSLDYSMFVIKSQLNEAGFDKNIRDKIVVKFTLHPKIEDITVLDDINSIPREKVIDFIKKIYKKFLEKVDRANLFRDELLKNLKKQSIDVFNAVTS